MGDTCASRTQEAPILLLKSVLLAVALIGTATGAASAVSRAAATGEPERLSHGRFHDVLVYQPGSTPTSVALFLSGDAGWNPTADSLARQLMHQGALVVGIDWPKFKANLEADGDQCVFPDGDLENLSHFVQAYYHVPAYLSPLLLGISAVTMKGTLAPASSAKRPE